MIEIVKQAGRFVLTRSPAEPTKNYLDYRELLRFDFWFSCAYCTITEVEAGALRFTIDHYEPRTSKAGKKLVNDYSNLMWSCDTCNDFKGDLSPPPEARAAGLRFFRPDLDDPKEHFSLDGVRIEALTQTGEFTKELLDLNRQSLRKLREIRSSIYKSSEQVLHGIRSLQDVPIDQLPFNVRIKFLSIRKRMLAHNEQMAGQLSHILRSINRSPILDKEESEELKERTERRRNYLRDQRALYPTADNWRSPGRKRSPSKTRRKRSR